MIELNKEEGIAIVTFNNPEKLNILSLEVLENLENLIKELSEDDEIKAVIFTGAGKAFIAGANIAEMKDMNQEEGEKFAKNGQRIFSMIENLKKPVIAAINGFALGGGSELALACDLRIASSKAKLGQPEVKLGVIPGFGGTQRLTKVVGIGKAKELILTGKIITAEEALAIGLVNKVVEPENLIEESKSIAKEIMQQGEFAVAKSKELINKSFDLEVEEGFDAEAKGFGECFSTDEQKEMMKKFLEKK